MSAPAVEIAELLQRLAGGGSLNATEYELLRARVAQNAGDPNSPLVKYLCNAPLVRAPSRFRDRRQGHISERCQAVIAETNAPYGRCRIVCFECGTLRTVFFGGYQRFADDRINGQESEQTSEKFEKSCA